MVERISLLVAERSQFVFTGQGQILLRTGPVAKQTRPAGSQRTSEEIDSRITIFRLEALSAAKDAMALNDEEYNRLRGEEQNLFRMNYFQEMRRRGRVNVDRNGLKLEILNFLEQEIAKIHSLHSKRIRGGSGDAPFLNVLTEFIANRITELILTASDSSVDLALTNNLRHGVIVPRFLRAFEDSLASVNTRPRLFMDWSVAALTPLFADAAPDIIQLRGIVSDLLEEFVSSHLDVDRNASFANLCLPAIKRTVLAAISKNDPMEWSDLAEETVMVGLGLVEIILREESEFLTSTTATEAMQVVSDYYALAQNRAVTQYISEFFDSLQSKLRIAFDEVAQWIQLVESSTQVGRFTLAEIVNLELLTTKFSDAKRLRVVTSVAFAERPEDASQIQFNGKYFDYFVHVIHNLISNCFDHSGLDLRTRIRIVVILSTTNFLIRISNDLSNDQLLETQKRLPDIIKLAQASNPTRARDDKLSGFQKIRRKTQQVFGPTPISINIPPIVQPRFTIELTVRASERVWLDEP